MLRAFSCLRVAVLLVSLLQMPTLAEDWSSFNVIDIHAHCGSFRGYDLSSAMLLENVSRFGVRIALVSNIDGAELPGTTRNLNEIDANAATAKLVNEHPKVLRGLIWSRPDDGNVQNVEQFASMRIAGSKDERTFVGVKFHPEFNNFAADADKVDPYLSFCEKHGLPAVFHCGGARSNSSAEKIYQAARRHPHVPVVLYHMGFGGDHQSAIDVVAGSLKNHDADLYLETAQADPDAVLLAVKKVGASRILFGTDATYFGKKHYENYAQLVKRLHADLPPEQFQLIMHGNAERLFRIAGQQSK